VINFRASKVSMRRAVFLDRDGVLNRAIIRNGKPYPPSGAGEFEILPEASSACQLLKEAGFWLTCVTNQPDVARGLTTRENVERLNDILMANLPIDEVRVCMHSDEDACLCRKPKPGLLLDAAAAAFVDLSASFMIGDRWRDIEAGRAAGCRTIFVDRNYDERQPSHPDLTTHSVMTAARWIVQQGPVTEGQGR
jgi:D-glycero-D-manno-heptose 1,7-bisphosphate phosphatase